MSSKEGACWSFSDGYTPKSVRRNLQFSSILTRPLRTRKSETLHHYVIYFLPTSINRFTSSFLVLTTKESNTLPKTTISGYSRKTRNIAVTSMSLVYIKNVPFKISCHGTKTNNFRQNLFL